MCVTNIKKNCYVCIKSAEKKNQQQKRIIRKTMMAEGHEMKKKVKIA